MTSVSPSEHDDEAPEGTGTGVSAVRGTSAARPDPEATAITPKTPRSTAAKAAAAKGAAAKGGASKGSAAKRAAGKGAADAASRDEAEQSTTSKRTAASRAASSKAAAVRGEAARTARTARTSAATSTSRNRAAATTSAKRQRVAAALTTETTAAERGNRKPVDADAAALASSTVSASPVAEVGETMVDESTIDETTRERPVDAAPVADLADVAVVEEPTASAELDPPVAVDPSDTVVEPATEDAAVESAVSVEGEQAVVVIPAPRAPKPRKKRTLRVARPAPAPETPRVLTIEGLVKRFGNNTAVDGISLDVRTGSFFGIVGPNGAGKTTTLSMVTGLLRPDAGTVRINGFDAWKDPRAAKRITGVLPDRLRLFDRLTGAQLLYYSGTLRGLDDRTVRDRSVELIAAFGLEDAVDRLVADYSAGMTKKIALACAMIHAPRLLVLDEPFESVDPVSAANLTDILERYVGGGGTVLLSSHSMDLIERVCDSAAIIIGGRVLASGTLDEVRRGHTLEDRFVELAGGRKAAEGMEWLHSFSD